MGKAEAKAKAEVEILELSILKIFSANASARIRVAKNCPSNSKAISGKYKADRNGSCDKK